MPRSIGDWTPSDLMQYVGTQLRTSAPQFFKALKLNILEATEKLKVGGTVELSNRAASDIAKLMPGYEYAHATLTGTYSNSATVAYSTLVTLPTATYSTDRCYADIFIPQLVPSVAGSACYMTMREGTTVLNESQVIGVDTTNGMPVSLRFEINPTAGDHAYNFAWMPSVGTFSINAAGTGYVKVRIYRA